MKSKITTILVSLIILLVGITLAAEVVEAKDFAVRNETGGEAYFFVNGGNGRVGIGTTVLNKAFNVLGGGNFTGNVTSQVDFCVPGVGCLTDMASSKIGGTGTENYIPLWSDNKTLTDSGIYQDSDGNLGLGTESPETELGMGKGSISGIDSIEWDVQTVNGARVETWDGASGPSDGDWGSWSTSGTVTIESDVAWTDPYEGSMLQLTTDSSATSPSITLDDYSWSGGRIFLSFWADFYGDAGGKHKIQFSNNGGADWKTIGTVNQPSENLDEQTGWQHMAFDVSDLAEHGEDNRIRFLVPSGSSGLNYVGIDNIRLVHAPSMGRWVGSDNPGDISYTGGNVGIGTDDPQNILNVGGDINATGNISSEGDICIEGKCLSEAGEGGGTVKGNGTQDYVPKWTDNDTLGDSVIYENGSTGNVGIGTDSPGAKLHVDGDSYFDDIVGIGENDPGSAFGGYNFVVDSEKLDTGNDRTAVFVTELAESDTSGRAFATGVSGESWVRTLFYSDGTLGVGDGSSGRDVFLKRSDESTFRIGSNFDGTGDADLIVNDKVGIGTTGPGQKFEVNGTAGYESTGDMGTADTAFTSKDYVDSEIGESGTMNNWTIAGDSGSSVVTDRDTVTISGGSGITTSENSRTVTIDADDANATNELQDLGYNNLNDPGTGEYVEHEITITDGSNTNIRDYYESDTNETGRFNNLTDGDCPGTDKVVGVDSNGNVVCDTDVDTNTEKSGGGIYLYNDTDKIYLNETELNKTIDARENNTEYTAGSNLTLDGTEFNWDSTWTENTFIRQSEEANLNVNSSDYWDDLDDPSDIDAGDINDDGTYYDTSSNINASGYNVTADYFIGNGSKLTGIETDVSDVWVNESGDSMTGGLGIGYSEPSGTDLHVDGDVGIGTTSPGAKLDVVGEGASGKQGFRINHPSSTSADGDSEGLAKEGTEIQSNEFYYTGDSPNAPIGKIASVNYNTAGTGWYGIEERYRAGLSFHTTYENNLQERMTITDQGNVGIGTTSPDSKLDVDGDGLFSGDLTIADSNTLYLESETSGELMQFDARGDSDDVWVHKYWKGDGGSQRWGEQWYDGSNYHKAWADSGGFNFGSDIQLNSGTSVNEFSTDENLGGNSDNAVPTEQAVKGYVDDVGAGDVDLASLTDGGGISDFSYDGTSDATVSHADTSSQGDVTTGGSTVIDDIYVDAYGHVDNMNTQNRRISDWDAANADVDMSDENLDDVQNIYVNNIRDADGGTRIEVYDHMDMNGDNLYNVGQLGDVDSTSHVDNLNADLLDGTHKSNLDWGDMAISTGDVNMDDISPANTDLDMNNNAIEDVDWGASDNPNTDYCSGGTCGSLSLSGDLDLNGNNLDDVDYININQDIQWANGEITSDDSNTGGRIIARATDNPAGGDAIFAVESSGGVTRFGVTQNEGGWFRDGLRVGYDYDEGGLPSNPDDLYVQDNVYADAFYYTSDENLKKNIKTLDNSLDKIKQINGSRFNWKESSYAQNNDSQLGIIAQDVEKVFPEAVETGEDGFKRVQTGNLVAPLIESVKELDAKDLQLDKKIDKQDERINEQEEKIKEQEKRIKELEKDMDEIKRLLDDKNKTPKNMTDNQTKEEGSKKSSRENFDYSNVIPFHKLIMNKLK